MGEEVRFAAQIRRIAGNITSPIDFLCRHWARRNDVPFRLERAGRIRQPMFPRRNAPRHAPIRQIHFARQQCHVHLHAQMLFVRKDFHRVADFIDPVDAQVRIICTLC